MSQHRTGDVVFSVRNPRYLGGLVVKVSGWIVPMDHDVVLA